MATGQIQGLLNYFELENESVRDTAMHFACLRDWLGTFPKHSQFPRNVVGSVPQDSREPCWQAQLSGG